MVQEPLLGCAMNLVRHSLWQDIVRQFMIPTRRDLHGVNSAWMRMSVLKMSYSQTSPLFNWRATAEMATVHRPLAKGHAHCRPGRGTPFRTLMNYVSYSKEEQFTVCANVI